MKIMKNKKNMYLFIGSAIFCTNLLAVSNGTADTLVDIEDVHKDTLIVLEEQKNTLMKIESVLTKDGVSLTNILFNQKIINNIEKEN